MSKNYKNYNNSNSSNDDSNIENKELEIKSMKEISEEDITEDIAEKKVEDAIIIEPVKEEITEEKIVVEEDNDNEIKILNKRIEYFKNQMSKTRNAVEKCNLDSKIKDTMKEIDYLKRKTTTAVVNRKDITISERKEERSTSYLSRGQVMISDNSIYSVLL